MNDKKEDNDKEEEETMTMKDAKQKEEAKAKTVEGIKEQLNVDPASVEHNEEKDLGAMGDEEETAKNISASYISSGNMMDVVWKNKPHCKLNVTVTDKYDHVFLDARIDELKFNLVDPIDFPAEKLKIWLTAMNLYSCLYKNEETLSYFKGMRSTILDPKTYGLDYKNVRDMFKEIQFSDQLTKFAVEDVPQRRTVLEQQLQSFPNSRTPKRGHFYPIYLTDSVGRLIDAFGEIESQKMHTLDLATRIRAWTRNYLLGLGYIVRDLKPQVKKYRTYIPYIFKKEGPRS